LGQNDSIPPAYYKQTEILAEALNVESRISSDTATIRKYVPPFTVGQLNERSVEWEFLLLEIQLVDEGGSSMTQIQELNARLVEFEEQVTPWWTNLENRKQKLSEIKAKLELEMPIWKRTHDSLPANSSGNILEKTNLVNDKLNALLLEVNDSLNITLDRQTMLAEEYGGLQTKQKELEMLNRNFYNVLKEVYYPFNSKADSLEVTGQTWSELPSPFRRTRQYLGKRKTAVYWHMAITVFFLLLFFFIRYEVKRKKPEGTNTTSVQMIVTYPVAAAISVSILMFLWLYPNRPEIFGEVISFLVVTLMTIFFTRFFERRIFIPWLLLYLAYLTNFFRIHFVDKEPLEWWLGLLGLGLILAQVWLVNRDKELIAKRYGRFGKRLNVANPIMGTLAAIIFILQLMGFYYLANYSVNVLLRISTFAMVLYIITLVLQGTVIFILNSRFFEWSRVVVAGSRSIQIKTKAWTNFGALVIWIWAFFRITGLTSSFRSETEEFINKSWELGTSTISLNQIFAFIIVIVVTILASSGLKNLLEIEILSRFNLKRGVPAAVAQMTRYFVLVIGFYLAIGAMGVNLNKLGFIAGALGVGIGFGLQNIVANFISGLILFLERPISKGDVVNVNVPGSITGRAMAEVLDIGIRSSKVKTYDGAEVIVPNSEFVSKEVVNFTLTDQRRRVERFIPLEIGTDPSKVIEIVQAAYKDEERILEDPEPLVLFVGYEQGAMNFRLLFWITDGILVVPSDLLLDVHKRFATEGVKVQKPAMDVELKERKK
jgi:small-conductance mechanosensitive channel